MPFTFSNLKENLQENLLIHLFIFGIYEINEFNLNTRNEIRKYRMFINFIDESNKLFQNIKK